MDTQLNRIQEWLEQQKLPQYRFTQIQEAWYSKTGWNEVTTLSKDIRETLEKIFSWSSIASANVHTSAKDETEKALLVLGDGEKIETVLMPNAKGEYTVCISSQVGCGMGCTFCATGTMGLQRQLTADEIVDQVRFWKFTQPSKRISHIVFMGMGEPLANYDAVKMAATICIEKLGVAPTHIIVSTVGIPVQLQKLLTDEDFPPVRIAFSLHAGTDETRQRIVPSHSSFSMQKIFDWASAYIQKKGNRRHHLTFEYVMLSGVNDAPSEAKALVKRFLPIQHRIKFNLIPWNPINTQMHRSSESSLHVFQKILQDAGFIATIRYSKGLDIDAACGQLAVKQEK